MTFDEVVSSVDSFTALPETDKVALAAWHLHEHCGQEVFTGKQVMACFDQAHLARPSNTSVFLASLVKQKRCSRDKSGNHKLLRDERIKWSALAGKRPTKIKVDAALGALAAAFASSQQQTFLDEVVACIRAGAFRSACVMAWNLAYDHLCWTIIDGHLAGFNAAAATAFKTPPAPVTRREDLEEWKECDVIRVARATGVITKNQYMICDQRLKRRNMFAHPSSVIATQLHAEEMILDLVHNVIEKL